jgi:DNA-binding response OmpR family regulator
MRVLYVTTPERTGGWLAEAFAQDSACEVRIEEAHGAAAGAERLRETPFDAVFVNHEPGSLDALSLVDGLRGGGAEAPLIVLGEASEQELAALCYEAGADGYVCLNTATTRGVLWIVARAVERHRLLRENRQLRQAARHRSQFEHQEADRLLAEQWVLAGHEGTEEELPAAVRRHYGEVLKAQVVMGSGIMRNELAELAKKLAQERGSGPQTVELHVGVLEELVRGLGNRSARHVMSRADLLLLELLVQLAEQYRQQV